MATLSERLERRDGGLYDGEVRYVMLRADVLMGAIARMGPAGFQALAESVTVGGGHSVNRYRSFGTADFASLLQMIEETANQLGWGRWQLARPRETTLRLTVHNSPFVAGHGPSQTPVCAAICGLLQATASVVLVGDGAINVEETECAAMTGEACRFVARLS